MKEISKETAELMIQFAAWMMDMKNDDWRHKIEWDIESATKELPFYLKEHEMRVEE